MIKTHQKVKIIVILLAFTMAFFQTPASAQAAVARAADVEIAGSGNILVGISGSYERVGKRKIVNRINEIRREACMNGYINPATGKKLKPSDYVKIQWSSNLEWIAQLRAAECTVNEDHMRPNGESCFNVYYNGVHCFGENLAWNYSGLMGGIEQWYSEKNDWVNRNQNAVTGHYASLINPEFRFIGVGSFIRDTGGWGWYGVAAEFSYTNTGSKKQSNLKGKTLQTIEVTKKNTSQIKLNAPSSIKVKETKRLTITCNVVYPGIMGGQNMSKARITKNVTWKSSKPSVISVNGKGKITGKKVGKSTITAKIKSGKKLTKTITVMKK